MYSALFRYFEGFFNLPVESNELKAGTNGVLTDMGEVEKIHMQGGTAAAENGLTLALEHADTPIKVSLLPVGDCIEEAWIYDVCNATDEAADVSYTYNHCAVIIAYVIDTDAFREEYGFPFPVIKGSDYTIEPDGYITMFVEYSCMERLEEISEDDIGRSLYDVLENSEYVIGYCHDGQYERGKDSLSWRHDFEAKHVPHVCLKVMFLNGYTDAPEKERGQGYVSPLQSGADWLDRCVHGGITNIAAGYDTDDVQKNLDMMCADLRECLSDEGLSEEKWKRFDKQRAAVEEAQVIAEAIEQRYRNAHFTVAAAGSQGRIGTTSFSLRLCAYLAAHGATVAYVGLCANTSVQLEMMCQLLDGFERHDNCASINGIDLFTDVSSLSVEKYGVVVYDFGSLPTVSEPQRYKNCDVHYLCTGTSYCELPGAVKAQKTLYDINYTLVLSYTSAELADRYNELLSVNLSKLYCQPFMVEPFDFAQNTEFFDAELLPFADEKAETAIQE